MKHSNYFKAVLFGFLGSCILFVLTTIYQIGIPTSSAYSAQVFHETKSGYATSIKTLKLLIVGGSGATYGISSHMIAEETGVPTVNLGSGAGLGARYILHRAQPLAKPGDTIVLALEYEAYELNPAQSEALIDYILAYDPGYLLTHPWFIASVPRARLIQGTLARFRRPITVEARQFISQSGDAIDNREADMTAAQRRGVSATPPVSTKGKLNPDALRSIQEFADWCRSQNITLLTTWPNTIWFEIYQEAHYQNLFQSIEKLYQSIGVPVLGEYKDFMYDPSLFYDSRYHLTDRGVRIRTRELMDLLEAHLQKRDTL